MRIKKTQEKESKMKVIVYFMSNAMHEFQARDERNAREIAKRIITEGCRVINGDGTEEFYPITQIYKTKILS